MLTNTLQKEDGLSLRETSSPAKKENKLRENLLKNKPLPSNQKKLKIKRMKEKMRKAQYKSIIKTNPKSISIHTLYTNTVSLPKVSAWGGDVLQSTTGNMLQLTNTCPVDNYIVMFSIHMLNK